MSPSGAGNPDLPSFTKILELQRAYCPGLRINVTDSADMVIWPQDANSIGVMLSIFLSRYVPSGEATLSGRIEAQKLVIELSAGDNCQLSFTIPYSSP